MKTKQRRTTKPSRRSVKRMVMRRLTLRGYIVPVFIWDHNDPPRMFLPTLTKTRANECDRECVIDVRWKAHNT